MEDFLKQPLELGDRVVFLVPGYRQFWLGKIVKFTAKMAAVEYDSPFKYQQGRTLVTRREYSDLIKVTGTTLTTYLLKR